SNNCVIWVACAPSQPKLSRLARSLPSLISSSSNICTIRGQSVAQLGLINNEKENDGHEIRGIQNPTRNDQVQLRGQERRHSKPDDGKSYPRCPRLFTSTE